MNFNRMVRQIAAVALATLAIMISWSLGANAQTIEGRWINQATSRVQLEISRVGRTWFVTDPSDRFNANDYTVLDVDDRAIAFKQQQWSMKPAGQSWIRDFDTQSGWSVVCKLSGADALLCQSTVYGRADGLSGGPQTYRRAR